MADAAPAARSGLRNPESRTALGMLIALTAIAPISIDMFLPSMPQMADDFNTSTGVLSLAVTLFLFAFAGSQLVYGPASDRFGRRPVLFAGLGLYILGGVLALFSVSVETLVAGRVIQGLGGGAGPAIASAIIIDVYKKERALKALAAMTVVTALAPMLAPIAGGFLHDWFGWRSVFVTLVGVGCLLTAGYAAILPETNAGRDPHALRLGAMFANYKTLWTTPVFAAHALLMALLFSGQLVFISSSSFVLVDDLGLSERLYGFSFGLVAFGIMAGATISRRLAGVWTPRRIVLTATITGGAMSSTMAFIALSGAEGVLLIVLPMMVVAGVNGMSGPAARSSALIPFPQMAGLASAVMGFSQIGMASAYSIGYNSLLSPGPVTMTCSIAAASVSALVVALLVGGRGIKSPPAT
ncbi:multidrug effflux MFS transporter [Candidatus Amarobacter glycogenicus]|uniref:multidrug effflux MFS transporter n=1 Tax=Candidatus Amarobacter glycogenicus TaxID=3140699 RepID=UPI003136E77B|nr:multidrug effflux MFS transporter [Dehalococcoidia bacterium]